MFSSCSSTRTFPPSLASVFAVRSSILLIRFICAFFFFFLASGYDWCASYRYSRIWSLSAPLSQTPRSMKRGISTSQPIKWREHIRAAARVQFYSNIIKSVFGFLFFFSFLWPCVESGKSSPCVLLFRFCFSRWCQDGASRASTSEESTERRSAKWKIGSRFDVQNEYF